MMKMSPEQQAEFDTGVGFLSEHKLEEVNSNPITSPFRDFQKRIRFPLIDAINGLKFCYKDGYALQAAGFIDKNDDPERIARIIIRLTGIYRNQLSNSWVPDFYPQLRPNGRLCIYVKKEGPCQEALRLIEEQFPDLVCRQKRFV